MAEDEKKKVAMRLIYWLFKKDDEATLLRAVSKYQMQNSKVGM